MDGLVLAGGRGSRLRMISDPSQQDGELAQHAFQKGLVQLAGRRLIDHVAATLRPMVDQLYINVNPLFEAYADLGICVSDRRDAQGNIPYIGPLAGVLAGLDHSRANWLAVAPCDSPFLPPDWATVLREQATRTQAAVAVARQKETRHAVCMVVSADVRDDLAAFLASGERKVGLWQRRLNAAEVAFDAYADHTFMNINTPSDLAHAEALIASDVAHDVYANQRDSS